MRLSSAYSAVLTAKCCPCGVCVVVAGPRIVLGHIGSFAGRLRMLDRSVPVAEQWSDVAFIVLTAGLTLLT